MSKNSPVCPQSQWCHPAGAITALYIYKIIYAKSKDKMMDDYMPGSSVRLGASLLKPCRNSTLTYTCKWGKVQAGIISLIDPPQITTSTHPYSARGEFFEHLSNQINVTFHCIPASAQVDTLAVNIDNNKWIKYSLITIWLQITCIYN